MILFATFLLTMRGCIGTPSGLIVVVRRITNFKGFSSFDTTIRTALIIYRFARASSSWLQIRMVACYSPFTSPMAMFTRIAMGSVAWYEIAASIAILVASTFGIGILASKIYRMGVLLYGNSPKVGKLIKMALKKD